MPATQVPTADLDPAAKGKREAAEACLRFKHVVLRGTVDEVALEQEAAASGPPTAQMLYNTYQVPADTQPDHMQSKCLLCDAD